MAQTGGGVAGFLGLGAAMFVSDFDGGTNRQRVARAGLRVAFDEVREQVENDRRITSDWLLAERPR